MNNGGDMQGNALGSMQEY